MPEAFELLPVAKNESLIGMYMVCRKAHQVPDRWVRSLIALYCATIVLGRYSSHSGKIHYIQDADLSYICGTTFSELWQFNASGSSLIPSTYFWPILLPSKPSHSRSHPQLIHIGLIYQACASKGRPDPAVPIIS